MPGAGSGGPATRIRAVELFSGIGGMRHGLEAALAGRAIVDVRLSVDVNASANAAYAHAFASSEDAAGPPPPLRQKQKQKQPQKQPQPQPPQLPPVRPQLPPVHPVAADLASVGVGFFDAVGPVDVWTLSPPCQPYTSLGARADADDPRAAALGNLVALLPRLAHPPPRILLENVRNFELSRSRDALVATLAAMGYALQEFLLSPTALGVPNDRLRYYLLARRVADVGPFASPQFDLADARSRSADGVALADDAHAGVPANASGRSRRTGGDDGPPDRDGDRDRDQPLLGFIPGRPGSQARAEALAAAEADLKRRERERMAAALAAREAEGDGDGEGEDGADLELGDARGDGEREWRVAHPMSAVPGYEAFEDVNAKRAALYAHCRPVSEFLEPESEAGLREAYLVPDAVLSKFKAYVFDIVAPEDRRSSCFTSSYGKFLRGTGSLLSHDFHGPGGGMERVLARHNGVAPLDAVRSLRLRYFSPREVAALMGFPADLAWPESFGRKQQWKLLGQSVSVTVVTALAEYLFA